MLFILFANFEPGIAAAAALSAFQESSALHSVISVPSDWQLELLLWLQSVRHPVLTYLMGTLTMLGDEMFYVTVLALMYWTGDPIRARVRRGAHSQVSGWDRQFTYNLMQLLVLSVLINIVIKDFVDAPRPFEAVGAIEGLWTFTAGSASFPSGHAQTAATFWMALALTGADVPRGKGGGAVTRSKTIGMACLFVFLIALSRLYLGLHWPRDVLAGALIGSFLGLLGPTLLKGFSRWSLIPTLGLSAIGILVFRDHSAVQLTGLLIGAALGHAHLGTYSKWKLEDEPATRIKPVPLLLGILAVAGAYGMTTWLLSAIGLPEIIVDGLATLETGLMVTWGVPAFLRDERV